MTKFIFFIMALLSFNAFADYVAPPYPFSVGGTSATTQQGAIDALMNGSSTTGFYLRYSGSHWVPSGIQVADVPTLNQSTTGNAATATNATNAANATNIFTTSTVGNASFYLLFASSTSNSDQAPYLNSGVSVNPSTATITATAFVGAFTGNASTATALATTPSQCTSGQFATGIAANGNANCGTPSSNWSVVNGGDTNYSINTGDQHVRSGTTLTAQRTYTLPACTSGNLGEKHEVKNLPSQTFNIILAGNGSDTLDGNANVTILPGGSKPVICAVSTNWDIE